MVSILLSPSYIRFREVEWVGLLPLMVSIRDGRRFSSLYHDTVIVSVLIVALCLLVDGQFFGNISRGCE